MRARSVIALAAWAAWAGSAVSAPPTLDADVAPRTCQIGDQVTIEVTITTEPGQHMGALEMGEVSEEIHIVAPGTLRPTDDGSGQLWRAVIVPFATGMHDLPPVRAVWTDADSATAEVTVDLGQVLVEAVIPEGMEPPGPKAPHGPFELPEPWSIWPAVVLGAFALLCLALWWIVRRLRRRGEPPATPAITRPPHEIALTDLDALEHSGLVSKHRFRQLFYEMTGIVRVYFEREFGLGAPEMTTAELLGALREAQFPAAICEQVSRWTTVCDLVKYASQWPHVDQCVTAIALARAIVISAHQHSLALRSAMISDGGEAA